MKLRSAVFGASTVALIIALALLSNALITSVNQATATQTNEKDFSKTTLTIVGYGSVKYAPDLFDITLTMIGRGETAHEALTNCNSKVAAVIDALKSLGISERDMETKYVNLYPMYDWELKPPKILGYEAYYTLGVKVRDAEKLGRVIDESVKAGTDRLDGLAYTLSSEKIANLKMNAIKAAVEDAKTKASIIAETLGLKVIGIESVDMSDVDYSPPIVYKNVAVGESTTPIIPGEGELKVTVRILFNLGPAA
ncbi:MAG: SIMPL domain-containing protein [Nitrososphaeria archaeon]|nr:SIMPL domain-containing protein [Nitrososphaeria archaeon]